MKKKTVGREESKRPPGRSSWWPRSRAKFAHYAAAVARKQRQLGLLPDLGPRLTRTLTAPLPRAARRFLLPRPPAGPPLLVHCRRRGLRWWPIGPILSFNNRRGSAWATLISPRQMQVPPPVAWRGCDRSCVMTASGAWPPALQRHPRHCAAVSDSPGETTEGGVKVGHARPPTSVSTVPAAPTTSTLD